MLEIGDNFIVLNNVVWKRIGFLYYDRLLKNEIENQVGLYIRYSLHN